MSLASLGLVLVTGGAGLVGVLLRQASAATVELAGQLSRFADQAPERVGGHPHR